MARNGVASVLAVGLAATLSCTAAAAMETILAPREGMYACESMIKMKTFIVESMFGGTVNDLKCDPVPAGTWIAAQSFNKWNGMVSGWGTSTTFRRGQPFAFFGATNPAVAPEPAAAPAAPKPADLPTAAEAIAKADAPRVYKLVSPRDVMATPSKWQRRDIEFRNVNVYWVDDNDVRILTNESLTIFARLVKGGEVIKDQCETVNQAMSAKCRMTIRFSYYDYVIDQPTGFLNRTALKSFDAELVRSARR